MPMSSAQSITRDDLNRFEVSIKKAIAISQKKNLEPAYLDLLKKIVDALNELRLTIEFDHEERLQAIEHFLQQK